MKFSSAINVSHPGPKWSSPAKQGLGWYLEQGEDQRVAAMVASGIPRWKRFLDITLIILTAPIWLSLMLATFVFLKCVSSGPVFYRQRRIGLAGKEFMIQKFRSMHVNADTHCHDGHVQALIAGNLPMTKLDVADPRVIPGGRLMRAVCLDELPQIFNVLRGEMSLVGPRPCTPREFEQYQPEDRQRADALPGLTGAWQVSGKNKLTFREMIALDLNYAKTMSMGGDLVILLMTFPAIIRQVLDSYAARRALSMEPKSGTERAAVGIREH